MILDQANLSRFFQRLIVFGKNGATVVLDQRSSGNRILFTKSDCEGVDWILEVVISGPNASETLLSGVEVATASDRFWFEVDMGEDGKQIGFSLSGTGLKDPVALETVGRLVTRLLGHPTHAKYRIRFGGPYRP